MSQRRSKPAGQRGRPLRSERERAFSARLGMRIEIIREQRRMSRSVLAAKLDMCPNTIARYERGERSIGFFVLLRICLILQVSLADLSATAIKG